MYTKFTIVMYYFMSGMLVYITLIMQVGHVRMKIYHLVHVVYRIQRGKT